MEALLAGKKLRRKEWARSWLVLLDQCGELLDESGDYAAAEERSLLGWSDVEEA
jgi:hypothetical protein